MRANNKEDSEITPLTKEGEVINKTKDNTQDQNDSVIRRKKTIKYSIIGGIVLVVVILAIVLPIVLLKKKDDNNPTPTPTPTQKPPTPPVPSGQNPYKVNEDTITVSSQSFKGQLNLQFQSPLPSSLRVSEDPEPAPAGFNWSESIKTNQYNQIAQLLNFSVEILDYKLARFELTNASGNRFSIPKDVISKPGSNPSMNLDMLGFNKSLNPFSFTFFDVTNTSNVLLTTEGQSLVMMDKFIQMDFLLPSQRLYGLGERVHEFQIGEGSWTMWAQGQDSPYDDGQGRKNLYGVHPFVLVQTSQVNDYIGIFFRNSAAQSPVVSYTTYGKTVLSYISIGGQIEVYFFIHGTAKEIISQYQNQFGKPQLPPYWSLGWQQASWKYTDLQMIQDVIGNYSAANLPLEVVYFDIPYMDNYADFSVNKTAFPNLADFTTQLKANNQRLVVIVDAAISADDTSNQYYVLGNKTNSFIQSSIAAPGKNGRPVEYGNNLISSVWPKKAVFMDWFSEGSSTLWNQGLDDLFTLVNYDGLWLDMSEATTFSNGETDTGLIAPKSVETSRMLQETLDDGWYISYDATSTADTYFLPFVVLGSDPQFAGNWDNMTLSLNATHPGITDQDNREYNVHSLYGHMMARRTQEYLYKKNSDRQFILTRSTFASSGRYTSHWLGDNWRDWNYLKYSIAGSMDMNMFGIPHVGADVCGFFGEKKEDEMCLAWIQLSTFYTLARAHQNLTWKGNDSERSEPYLLKEPYLDQARTALFDRYSYLRMMYTCLFEANQMGQTCFDPVFFHFPNDENTHTDVESTFISSNAVLVAPVLQPLNGSTEYTAYLPQGVWVNLADFEDIIDAKEGMTVNLTARAKVNAYLKQGSLIPHQDNTKMQIKNTVELLQAPINLVVNRDTFGHAYGTILLDQGTSRTEIDNWQYEYYNIRHQANSVLFQLKQGKLGTQSSILGSIQITNAKDLSNVDNVCVIGWDNEPLNVRPAPPVMSGSTLQIQFGQRVVINQIKSIHYGNSADPNYINLCDPTASAYYLNNDLDLTQTTVTATLSSMSGRPDLSVTISIFDERIINVKWSYANATGKRPVADLPQQFINTQSTYTGPDQLKKYISTGNKGDQFRVDFKSHNSQDTDPLLSLTGMIYDEYINRMELEMNTMKGSNYTGVFGLGERAGPNFFYPDGVYTTYSKDQGTPDEDGKEPTKGTYGVHPFMVYQHGPNSWAGLFNKVPQASDYWIKNDKVNGQISLKSVAVGGNGDLFVFIDDAQPEDVVTRYYKLTGAPVLVPQWALGWNHCKWGYQTAEQLLENVQNYNKYQLPLDVQWVDIDYMNAYRDFTYDPVSFANLPTVIDSIHDLGVKFVPIVDIGVSIRPNQNYTAYDEGVTQNVFIKIGDKNEDFIGNVWPNEAAYPDFFSANTTKWWQQQVSNMYQNIKFDGLWLDMNELSNFCDGVCKASQAVTNPVQNRLIYIPGGINLESHAVSLDAKHANGQIELDTHSFQGALEVQATSEWFVKQQQRPFIIERSSVAGMGKYGSRWLGDNESLEKHMGYSVTGIMMMNMFGIPLAGSDICGFGGNTNAELCARWHVVGSYYPFSRNHNAIGSVAQEPWVFTGEYEPGMTYLQIMGDAIRTKYALIRYYYTNLFTMSVLPDPKPFYKPVFFAYPEDPNTQTNFTYNVMLGDSLKLSILSDKLGVNVTTFYMPAGTWCSPLKPTQLCFTSAGQTYDWPSKAYDSYVHQAEGTIVPLQQIPLNLNTSAELQKLPVDFHVVGTVSDPDTLTWSATGTYINDDGITLDTTGNYNQYVIISRRSGSGATEKMLFTINPNVKATKHVSETDPLCFAVNQNDFLGTIYFYVAGLYTPSKTYTVTAVDAQFKPLEFTGTATYDSATDRIVFTPTTPVCLGTNYQYILVPSAI